MTYTSVRILASGLVSLIAAIMAGLALADPFIFAAWIVWPAVVVSLASLVLTGYWFFKQGLTKASILAVILAGLAIPTLMGAAYSTMNSSSDVLVDNTTVIAPAPAEDKPNAAAPGNPTSAPESAPDVAAAPQTNEAPAAQSTSAPLTPEQAAAAEGGAGATNDNQAQDEVPDTTELPDFNEPDLPAATFDDEATSE